MVANWQFEDVPGIGHSLKNFGRTIDILSSPCPLDGEIVVRAAFSALPWLVWGIFKPETLPVTFVRTGPKRGHRRGWKFRPFNGISVTQGQLTRGAGAIGTAFFRIGAAAQRVGLWMLVLDATSEFVVHWASTAYQMGGCLPPKNIYARVKNDDPNDGYNDAPQTLLWAVDDAPFGFTSIFGVIAPTAVQYQLSLHLKTVPWAPFPNLFGPSKWRLYNAPSGNTFGEGEITPGGGGAGGSGGKSRRLGIYDNLQLFSVEVQSAPGRWVSYSGSYFLMSAVDEPLGDP